MVKTIQSFSRGLNILRTFNLNPKPSLTEVSKMVGLPKATCLRFLRTLEEEGYIYFDENYKRYELRPLVFELGYAALSSISLSAVIQPIIDRLAEKTCGSVTIATIDNSEIVITGRAIASPSRRKFVTINLNIGQKLPAHCSATGIILVGMSQENIAGYWDRANLEALTESTITDKQKLIEITKSSIKDGYAIIQDQLMMGYSAVAVPLKKVGRKHYAIAISLASHNGNNGDNESYLVEKILPSLKRAAAEINNANSANSDI